ncbi:MAG: lipid-A-disaccharide synthase, partial [Nevskia sp.]|nr:lipid-A-disaccharide synthase [Nevskia sp.]
MRFALIAGEASGDLLGGALVQALRARFPNAAFYGVTGPRMRQAGCDSLDSIDRLSVMGLAEVLPKLPDILRLRGELARRLAADRPDCVIGIDAPDFNLPLERRLRGQGIPTVHVVSPTVWAWRPGRVKNIARAVDMILCLFPFETRFYAEHHVKAEYIGHPLAEELSDPVPREEARRKLGVADGPCLAILPGSRGGELKYLAEPFVQTAAWLAQRL